MLRVVVAEAESAGRVLIMIGEGESFDAIVADPHVFSNVQLGPVREGERRAKISEIIRSGVSQQIARQQEPGGLVFVNEAADLVEVVTDQHTRWLPAARDPA